MTISKKLVLATLIAGVTAPSVFAAGEQGQGSGKVVFHGYIVDAPCSLVSQEPISVDFGQISRKVLAANNNTGESHIKPFAIELADCTFDEPRKDSEGKDSANSYVGDRVSVTFSYNEARGEDSKGAPVVIEDMVGFDGKDNMGAGVVIVSGGSRVKNGIPLPPQKLQSGPNSLEFTSYVKGAGIPDSGDKFQGIKTGEFYATANFTMSYE